MSQLKPQIQTDSWINTTWNEYLNILEDLKNEKAKCYYNNGRYRIEMTPLGSDHSKDHSIINHAIHLFATLNNIDLNGHDNCSYRKAGFQEAQPDLSYYIGKNAEAIPWGTKIISLDSYPVPNLVIEVASTSIRDDKGEKRLLYEDLGVDEYWIVDVNNSQMIAFAVADGGSRRIQSSQILPGLAISVLEEALQRTRQSNHGKVGAWLLNQFQQL